MIFYYYLGFFCLGPRIIHKALKGGCWKKSMRVSTFNLPRLIMSNWFLGHGFCSKGKPVFSEL